MSKCLIFNLYPYSTNKDKYKYDFTSISFIFDPFAPLSGC